MLAVDCGALACVLLVITALSLGYSLGLLLAVLSSGPRIAGNNGRCQ